MVSIDTDRVEQIGAITCPSGKLAVLDGKLAWMWSHERAPLLPDWHESSGKANAAVDVRLVGADAVEAGRAFDRSNNPLFIFDCPSDQFEALDQSFRAFATERGLDARLQILPERIPHRRRVDLAVEAGGGSGVVEFHGMWAAVVSGVSRDVTLPVFGERMPPGPDEHWWRRVWIQASGESSALRRVPVGHVLVDEARLMATDVDALGSYDDDEPVDGMADVVFWGRDAEAVAREVGAAEVHRFGESGLFGRVDLPLDAALTLAQRVEGLRNGERGFAVDFRPHTHHWQLMRDVRATSTESGVLDVGGARLCMFMTTWGDGAFPIEADLDSAGRTARIRIELGCDEMVRRQRDLEARWSGAGGAE